MTTTRATATAPSSRRSARRAIRSPARARSSRRSSPRRSTPRTQRLRRRLPSGRRRSRSAIQRRWRSTPMRELTVIEAVREALAEEMARDEHVLVLGEDVGKLGGVFRATEGLFERFGAARVVDMPMAETVIAGVAVGLAMRGLRPVAEIQFADFIHAAMDHLVGEAAKIRWRTGGDWSCPMVLRTAYGGGFRGGPYHSQSVEAFYAHAPGLKVVAPSTLCEWYGPPRNPPPYAVRSTIGHDQSPPVRQRIFAASPTRWSIAAWMKSANWISATGRSPRIARPTATPAITVSAIGMSTTRAAPKRSNKPSVARKTPPSLPTSSPRTRTCSSRAISSASASRTASITVSSRIGVLRHRRWIAERLRLRPLGSLRRKRCVLGVDLRGELRRDERARAGERIARRALRLELGAVAVARVVVIRGVRHEPHAGGVDQGRTLPGPRACERRARRGVHRLDVAAVDGDPGHPVAFSALHQRRRRVLILAAHRLRPSVAVHDEDARQLVDRGDVHRLVRLAFLRAAVTERDHRHAAVAEQLRAPRAADAVAAMVRLRVGLEAARRR